MPAQSTKKIYSTQAISNSIDIVAYHANCIDGFASAWVIHKIFPNAQFIALSHGAMIAETIKLARNKKILMVDFCYPRQIMLELMKNNQINIIDHHITGFNNLQDLIKDNQILGLIDLNYSGAKLCWQYYFATKKAPKLIDYIEDIDLWNLQYPETKAVCSALKNYPFDFSTWDSLMKNPKILIKQGEIIIKYIESILADLIKQSHKLKIGNWIVPAVNAPSAFSSELGNRLAQKKPFAAIYYCQADSYKISLRSTRQGEDVAKIAESFGGGGHRQAAGFKICFDQLQSQGIEILK